MSGSQIFWPQPQVGQPQQPLGGSPLATAMSGVRPAPALPSPGNGLAPLMSMLQAQNRQPADPNAPPGLFQQGMTGIGNLLGGSQWNGMPGQGQMDLLNKQAAQNAAVPLPPGAGGVI